MLSNIRQGKLGKRAGLSYLHAMLKVSAWLCKCLCTLSEVVPDSMAEALWMNCIQKVTQWAYGGQNKPNGPKSHADRDNFNSEAEKEQLIIGALDPDLDWLTARTLLMFTFDCFTSETWMKSSVNEAPARHSNRPWQ